MRRLLKSIPIGVLSVVATAVVVFLLLSPSSNLSTGWFSWLHFKNHDKLIHFILFFVLCFTYLYDYTKYRSPRHNKLDKDLALTSFAALIGLLTETGQLILVNDRSFEVADIIADVLGAFIAFAFMRWRGEHWLRKFSYVGMRKYRQSKKRR
jgi:ABC-type tungstate transport system substrate-binding protein